MSVMKEFLCKILGLKCNNSLKVIFSKFLHKHKNFICQAILDVAGIFTKVCISRDQNWGYAKIDFHFGRGLEGRRGSNAVVVLL